MFSLGFTRINRGLTEAKGKHPSRNPAPIHEHMFSDPVKSNSLYFYFL